MQGIPDVFHDKCDDAQFRHPVALPGVELYHARILHHAFEPHTHEAYGIGAIISGSQRFKYRGEQHIAPAGSMILMDPDELHTGQANSEQGWQYRMLYLEPAFLEKFSGLQAGWFRNVVQWDPLRAQVLSRLITDLWQTDDDLIQHSLLLNFVETFQLYMQHERRSQQANRVRFDLVRDYLHDNYMHHITLDNLAALVPLSRYHFLRQFKAHYHATPHQMLMAIRLWRAKQFLSAGMPAAQVAACCGLTDQSHLNRAFTQRYGTTPGRFQKQTVGSALLLPR